MRSKRKQSRYRAHNKAQSLRIHAKRRIKQRYGLRVVTADISAMICKIQSGQAECLLRVSNTRSFFKVQHEGIDVIVLYHKRYKQLVTALTPQQFADRKEKQWSQSQSEP